MTEQIATCPRCHQAIEPNDVTWPLTLDDAIVDGGCQTCWEDECAEAWWEQWTPEGEPTQ